VQSVHPPIETEIAVLSGGTGRRGRVVGGTPAQAHDLATLPTVAVFDSGVPRGHSVLEPYRRGQYVNPNSAGIL
jgi:hypothetical protein